MVDERFGGLAGYFRGILQCTSMKSLVLKFVIFISVLGVLMVQLRVVLCTR